MEELKSEMSSAERRYNVYISNNYYLKNICRNLPNMMKLSLGLECYQNLNKDDGHVERHLVIS